jgi:hypothetical protein
MERYLMGTRLTELSDRRLWDLSGFTLDRICIDYQATLLFSQPGSSVTVVIEEPFTLRAGVHINLITPDQALSVTPLFPVLHTEAVSLAAYRNGQLCIAFGDGTEITVPKSVQFESWHTFGDGELTGIGMLCSPHDGTPWG